MKDVSISATCLFLAFLCFGLPNSAVAIDGTRAVSVGGTGFTSIPNYTNGVTEQVRIERKVSRLLSLYAQLQNIEYRYSNGFYLEHGRGQVGTLGMNFSLPLKSDLQGWYFGFGISAGSIQGHWEDDRGTPFVTRGGGSSTIGGPSLHAGYKKYLGSSPAYYIEPLIEAGVFHSVGLLGGLGPHFNAGVLAGVAW
jgi:hypothetical protein